MTVAFVPADYGESQPLCVKASNRGPAPTVGPRLRRGPSKREGWRGRGSVTEPSFARLLFEAQSARPTLATYREVTPPSKQRPRVRLEPIDDLLVMMAQHLDRYHERRDRRALFLDVYLGLTERLRDNLAAGRFLDGTWVTHLAYRFAGMYFEAEEAFDRRASSCPGPWRRAFELTLDGGATALESVLLGMNAHIGYDLPRALASMLRDFDLPGADGDRLVAVMARRKLDHEIVNNILGETVDGAQDRLARSSLGVGVVDRLGLRFDELLSEVLIRYVRERSWMHGLALAFCRDAEELEVARREVETSALAGVKQIDLVNYVPMFAARWLLHLRRRPF